MCKPSAQTLSTIEKTESARNRARSEQTLYTVDQSGPVQVESVAVRLSQQPSFFGLEYGLERVKKHIFQKLKFGTTCAY